MSTLVTLVLIPVIYIIFDNLEKKFGNKFHKFSEGTSERYEHFKEDKIKSKFRKLFNIDPKPAEADEKIDLNK